MNFQDPAVRAMSLRWVVGLVVIWEAARFIFLEATAQVLVHMHLLRWIAPVLGGAEILAAILFLTPIAQIFGGYALLIVFAVAAMLHVLHGQYGIGGLLVYAASVWASMGPREGAQS